VGEHLARARPGTAWPTSTETVTLHTADPNRRLGSRRARIERALTVPHDGWRNRRPWGSSALRMIDRMARASAGQATHRAPRPRREIAYEEMFTRDGFDGAFTLFYHRIDHRAKRVERSTRVHPIARVIFHRERRASQAAAVPHRPARPKSARCSRSPSSFYEPRSHRVLCADRPRTDEVFFGQRRRRRTLVRPRRNTETGVAVRMAPGERRRLRMGTAIAGARWHVMPAPRRYVHVHRSNGGVHVPKHFRNPVGQFRMDAPYTHS